MFATNNPLQSLALDYWYKAVLAISTALLIVSLTVPLQGVRNDIAQLLCLGGIFVGLGEWVNHPLQESIGAGFKLSGHPRRSSFLGTVLDLLGLACIGYGLYRLIHSA